MSASLASTHVPPRTTCSAVGLYELPRSCSRPFFMRESTAKARVGTSVRRMFALVLPTRLGRVQQPFLSLRSFECCCSVMFHEMYMSSPIGMFSLGRCRLDGELRRCTFQRGLAGAIVAKVKPLRTRTGQEEANSTRRGEERNWCVTLGHKQTTL